MGKDRGFLETPRLKKSYEPVKKRITHYQEFSLPIGQSDLETQGARCMDCGIPYCHSWGCPLENLIPEWNELVYKGHWKEAYRRLELTSPFSEFTGRICPAPCEKSCTLSIHDSPVMIQELELAIVEQAFQQGWITPQKPKKESGKRVAVVGSGPAGLAAAMTLRRAGNKVTVFEQSDAIGGLLRYGIPEFKLEKKYIDRRIALMKAEGVRFETSVTIGKDLSMEYVQRSYDAILLAIGAGEPRDIPVGGRGLEGIHFAMEYLTQSNKYALGAIDQEDMIWAGGKDVLVIGGGDTGSDCVGTAIRQGAKSVRQIEIMPKPLEWKEPYNPNWPDWPQVLRTSTSHQEGCTREWEIGTSYFSGRDTQVERAVLHKVRWVQDTDASGRPTGSMHMQEVPDSGFEIPTQLVLIAAGFVSPRGAEIFSALNPKLDSRGNIATKNYATSVPGVFAAGDAVSGPSLVVRALASGLGAAAVIEEFLLGKVKDS